MYFQWQTCSDKNNYSHYLCQYYRIGLIEYKHLTKVMFALSGKFTFVESLKLKTFNDYTFHRTALNIDM